MKRRAVWLSAGLLVLTLLLRIPPVVSFPVLSIDEVYLAVAAGEMRGGRLLYREIISDKPPLLHALYYLLPASGPARVKAAEAAGIAAALLVTALVLAIARRTAGEAAGWAAGYLYAVFSATFFPSDMAAANREIFMILPLSLSAWFFLRGEESVRRGGREYFLAGACAGLGGLFKQPGFTMAFALLLSALSGLSRPGGVRRAAARVGWIFAGLAAAIFGCALFFQIQRTLSELVFWSWTYGLAYSGSVPWEEALRSWSRMAADAVLPNPLFWGMALAGIVLRGPGGIVRGRGFLLLWGIFSAAGAALGKRLIPHYLIQVFPPFAVLAGAGFGRLLRICSAQGRPASLRLVFVGGSILLALASIAWSYRWRFEPVTVALDSFRENREVADFVRSASGPADSVFAWGYLPEVYLYSGRPAASRFLVADFAAGKVPTAPPEKAFQPPGVMDLLLEDLERNRPLFVVDGSLSHALGYGDYPIARYGDLWKYLHRHYAPETVIRSRLVYRRRPAPLSAEESAARDEESRLLFDYSLALALAPADAVLLNESGVLLARRGERAGARERFLAALRARPDLAEARNNLGLVLQSAGDPSGAEAEFRRAIALAPRFARAQANLGAVLVREGRWSEALEPLRTAIALSPSDPFAYNDLGIALFRLGRREEAAASFGRALEIRPGLESARRGLESCQ